MNLFYIIALVAFLPVAAFAQTAAQTAAPVPDAPLVVAASEVVLADLIWLKRPVVVFADSPNDPSFIRQMQLLERNPQDLIERDVLVITDTDPAAATDIRQKLRPRGFSLVIMDKDGQAKLRKPLPWDVREISHAIDKFPLRVQETLEKYPAGR